MGKFTIKKNSSGWVFNLKAANGEIIAVSEVYASSTGCRNGVQSVRANAAVAGVEDQTAGETAKHPKFEIFKDKAGEFRFRLKAPNGEIIAASEGYTTKNSCLGGIDSVRKNAVQASLAVE